MKRKIFVLDLFFIFYISSFLFGTDWCYEYVEQKKYDKAIEYCSEYIRKNPNDYISYNNRGRAYMHKGMYDRAIEDYSKIIEINPKYAGAYNSLAWLYATAKDKRYRNGKKAVELALKAVELSPSGINLDTLAAAYVEDKQFQKSL